MKRIERFLELLIFNSRWLLAPFCIGLVVAIAMLLIKFVQEFMHIVPRLLVSTESEVILAILTIVDMALVANLLLIIIFSGYENFGPRSSFRQSCPATHRRSPSLRQPNPLR
ncbi:MAG: YqhA family protein, partial [Gammaproteobacteria bacterium]